MTLIPDLAKVTFLSNYENNQAVSNTFHIVNPGLGHEPSLPDLVQLGADLQSWFTTTYRAMLKTTSTWQSITVSQVPDAIGGTTPLAAATIVNLAGTGGALGANHGPDSITGVLQFKTPATSRRFRGHIFLPGPRDPAQAQTNLWDPAGSYTTASAALGAKFLAGCAPTATWTGTALASYFLCIYSKAADLAGVTFIAECTNVHFDTKVHWLRSRERGVT